MLEPRPRSVSIGQYSEQAARGETRDNPKDAENSICSFPPRSTARVNPDCRSTNGSAGDQWRRLDLRLSDVQQMDRGVRERKSHGASHVYRTARVQAFTTL